MSTTVLSLRARELNGRTFSCHTRCRDRFTPSGAPVQKKCGAPIIWILWILPPRLPSPDTHSSRRQHFVEDPCCNAHYYCSSSCLAVWGHTKSFPIFPNHYFNISGLLPCCKKMKKFFVLLWGPLFVGPLFGRTCWTCLNPPLTRWCRRDNYGNLLANVVTIILRIANLRPSDSKYGKFSGSSLSFRKNQRIRKLVSVAVVYYRLSLVCSAVYAGLIYRR